MDNEAVILQEIDKLMDNIVDKIFQRSQENLIREGKVDTGTLLKTANINREFLKKEIVFPALYADVIEYGRAPGSMPPVEALEKWVMRKLGIEKKKAKSVCWAIAMAIKQRGMAATPFLRPAIESTFAELGGV